MEANPEDVVDGTPLQPPTVEGVLKVVVGGGTGGGQVVVGGGNSGGGTGGGTGGGSPEKEAPPPKKETKEGITEELSLAELIEMKRKIQYHDPDVLPMDRGGVIMVPIFHITYAAI